MNRVLSSLLWFALSLPMLSGVQVAAEDGTGEWNFQVVPGFPQPSSVNWGAVSAVAESLSGNILVFHRSEPPILFFDREGKLLRSFGNGLFSSAHGLRVDSSNNVWVTDNVDHTVTKFNADGEILMRLGVKNVPGNDDQHFNKPTDIAFAANGDFYVSDGYGNSRVVKFDRTGRFLLAWGNKGKGPGEFNLPHAIQLDAHEHVYVGDRENDRIQVFDSTGKLLRQFGGFAPFGMTISPDQKLFVADGRAHKVLVMTLEGQLLATLGAPGSKPGDFQLPHGITVSKEGAIYVTEITGKRVQKFIRTTARSGTK